MVGAGGEPIERVVAQKPPVQEGLPGSPEGPIEVYGHELKLRPVSIWLEKSSSYIWLPGCRHGEVESWI